MSETNPVLEPAGDALRVDVISDVVCPWCYVGKRQLEQALARWQDAHPDAPAPVVRWHPFQLNPDLPEEGIARSDYLQRKFGTPDPASIYQRVGAAARSVGLAPEFERIARQPNTLRAHALIGAAAGAAQEAVVERLFEAYFNEGADLSSRETLEALASEAGLPDDAIRAAMGGGAQDVARADTEARRLGVSGVPFFVIDGKVAVSGAQGSEALIAAFDQARG
jgi:predicted DsbA family dithiol-disulfide isomerase